MKQITESLELLRRCKMVKGRKHGITGEQTSKSIQGIQIIAHSSPEDFKTS